MTGWLGPQEWQAVALSLRVAVAATGLSLPFGILAAYALARWSFWGKPVVNGLIHLPLVLPLSLFDIAPPAWALDYLTMAAACFAAMFLADRRDHRRKGSMLHGTPVMLALCLLWPISVIGYTALYLAEQETDAAEVVVVFFEMTLHALVLIAMNYALLRGFG